MLIKPITYQDLDGNPITENFCFNLNKAEAMEIGVTGWLQDMFEKYSEIKSEEDLKKPEDREALVLFFKKIIRLTIGRRSEDNKRFIKNDEIADEFIQSDAYSVLFWELFTNPSSMAEFFKETFPKDLDMAKVMADAEALEASTDAVPPWVQEDREPTSKELQSMTPEQLRDAYMRKASPKAQ